MLPSFVFRWLKESSATGFLRFGKNINKRVQDGRKRHWLCYECEQMLCGWETQFAKKVFHPLIENGDQNIVYGDWMLKFCVSVSWQILSNFVEDANLRNFNESQVRATHDALRIWSGFLLGTEQHPGCYEQHFLPMGLYGGDISGANLPPNLNRYLLRSADATPAASNAGAFVYSKLERFIIIGFIDIASPRQWVGTKVHVRKGRVGSGHFALPRQFGDFLLERCKLGLELHAGITERQQHKIATSMQSNKERLISSQTMMALDQDVRLFGKKEVFQGHE